MMPSGILVKTLREISPPYGQGVLKGSGLLKVEMGARVEEYGASVGS